MFHNSMLVMGDDPMEIGSNCWFGQNTILDSAGGLFIENGVTVGTYSQIWTHVARGELIEGCTLFAKRPTRIEDDVWLVGGCIVSPGLTLGRRSICLSGSVVTKDAVPGKVYAGVPAKLMEELDFWKQVTIGEKLEMMEAWVEQFTSATSETLTVRTDSQNGSVEVADPANSERLVISTGVRPLPDASLTTTFFDLSSKEYTKTLSRLERRFCRFLLDHKARFLPFPRQESLP
jgi:acetyltransferase-like isoleucine patch superfamily enzyme